MPISEVERFSRDVAASKSLQEELKALGSDPEGIVAFANARAYDFTASDLRKVADSSKAKLDIEQLDNVAGANSVAVSVQFYAVI